MKKLQPNPGRTDIFSTSAGHLTTSSNGASKSPEGIGLAAAFIPISSAPMILRAKVLVIGRVLERMGILALMCDILNGQSTIATSIEEALELTQHHAFDLIIVDHDLPAENGLAVIQTLRENKVIAPAILLTKKLAEGFLWNPAFLNIKAVLEKPLSMSRLERAMKKGLS